MAFTLEAVSLLLKLRHLVKVVVVTILCIASNISFAKFQIGYALWESNLRFLFAVFYPNLHIIFNFALDQAIACLRRLICLAFRRFGFKPV